MQVKTMVENILAVYPDTINDDTELYCQLANWFLNTELTKEQIEAMKKVPFESVTRCRREIVKEGKFKVNEQVQEERETKERLIREKYNSARNYLMLLKEQLKK